MAGYANPRSNFNWVIEIDGLNQFLVQEVTPPTTELKELVHGAPMGMPDEKTPGKPKFGDLVVTKLMPAFQAERWATDWMAKALAGSGFKGFVKNGFLKYTDPTSLVTVENYFLGNIWPKKIEPGKLVTKSDDSDNLLETVTFSVQYFINEASPEFKRLFSGSGANMLGIAFPLGNAGT